MSRLIAALGAVLAVAAAPAPSTTAVLGPYHASFIAGGVGIAHTLPHGAPVLAARAPFTLSMWVNGAGSPAGPVLLASIGTAGQAEARRIGVDATARVFVDAGGARVLVARHPLASGRVHFVALAYDGATARLYFDREVATAPAAFAAVPDAPPATHWDVGTPQLPRVDIAPVLPGAADNQHFAGRIAGFALADRSLSSAELAALGAVPPNWTALTYDPADKPWPVQTRQQAGQRAPQDPATLPVSRAPFGKPVAKPAYAGPALVPDGENAWVVAGGWGLAAAPGVHADGAAVSRVGFDARAWMAATVPGTVLTTMVDRGVYPDPAFGLNNMAIPERLARQDYWYRTEIVAPRATTGKRTELLLNGINYAAEVWLNGERLGQMTGAFIRGRFDVTGKLLPGAANVLAVRVSPPPHPGIPNEESLKGGSGDNGGMMMLDGPTFVATEGWDWIPGIRTATAGCGRTYGCARRATCASSTRRWSPRCRSPTGRAPTWRSR